MQLPALPSALPRIVRTEFRLDWKGIHGAAHWARVMRHGLHVVKHHGGDPLVVRLFALLHDSQRVNEGRDEGHGARAAEFAVQLNRDGLLGLNSRQLDWLRQACEEHSNGKTQAAPTVQACWDADRLDLGRVGTYPNPRFLCTEAAMDQDYIQFAYRWSQRDPSARHQSSRWRADDATSHLEHLQTAMPVRG